MIVGNVGTLGKRHEGARRRSRRPARQALGSGQERAMFLSDVSIKRPVFATMMMVALVVLGIVVVPAARASTSTRTSPIRSSSSRPPIPARRPR